MRLEITISDDLPEAQILGGDGDSGAYVLELVRIDRGHSAPQNGKPDYATIFDDAQNCPSAFKTTEEVDRYIDNLRGEW